MEQSVVPTLELPHLEADTTQYCDQPADEGSSMSNQTLVPQFEDNDIWVGKSFKSAECVKAHYRHYAMKKGFGMKVRNSIKGADGNVKYMMFACVREGNYVSSLPHDLKTNPTRKMKCPAKMCASQRKDGLWYITKINDDHCHDLSPGKSRMFQGNRRISMHVKRTIQVNDDAGVRVNKSFRSLVQEAGGYENLPFVERDIRNFVQNERKRLGKEGDGKALREYFSRMQKLNSNFFYEIDLDDDFHVKNVFWADAKCRAAYEYFGDVISFDTTYLTNKYDMPFAPFVGVNHHGQSILLGCGLLSAEDTDSFTWLFKPWLNCMSGKTPHAIVTDQCKAMKKAIQEVFPNARHRWCLWHIMKKIPEKFKGHLQYKSIKDDMKTTVYESLEETEFEDAWNAFVTKYDLHDNEWLSGLYIERSKWVPCFLKKNFWAGMSTTQRSESMNAFFDGYINSRTSLQQFVTQYDNALKDKAEKEYEADFRSFNSVIPCGSNSHIERQFQKEYTHSKFNEVQAEFRGKMNCIVRNIIIDGSICTYEIMEEMQVVGRLKEGTFRVVFNRNDHEFNCTCLLFQFRGIICRHSLHVLAQEGVKQVPVKYILPRWSKNIRRNYAYIKSSYPVKQLQPQMQRFDELCNKFYKIAEIACETVDATSLLDNTMNITEERVKEVVAKAKSNDQIEPTTQVQADLGVSTHQDQANIRSPKRKTRKGRPPSKRKMSRTEQAIKKKKLTYSRRPTVQMHDHNEGMTSQQCDANLHLESTIETNSRGCEQPHSLLAGVNGSTNEEVYLGNYWTSELSGDHASGFISLLTSFQDPSIKNVSNYSNAYQMPYFGGGGGQYVPSLTGHMQGL